MESANYKVTDIFGYLPCEVISLNEIESLFFNALDGICSERYKVFFNSDQVELNSLQLEAIEDLKELRRNIAYVTQGSKLVAIIGYHQFDYL